MLKPFRAEPMTMWPVSTSVNTPKNDDEDLIRPVRLPDEPDGDHWNVPRASGTGSESGPVNSE